MDAMLLDAYLSDFSNFIQHSFSKDVRTRYISQLARCLRLLSRTRPPHSIGFILVNLFKKNVSRKWGVSTCGHAKLLDRLFRERPL